MHQSAQQLVKTYRSGWGGYAEKKFAKDAAKLARHGWRVQSQSTAGVDWLAKRPQNITVVYVKS